MQVHMGLQVHMQVHIHMGLNYERRCIQTKQRTEIQKKGQKHALYTQVHQQMVIRKLNIHT